MTPLVSVVVAVHDDRDRLPRAVRSALSPGVLEVIVVDDGSTDGTAEVAQALAAEDSRVVVRHRPERSGRPGVPRNEGLDAARGEYVLVLDSDDELEPGAVEALLAEAERTGADAVFGRTTRVNPARGTTTEWMPWLFEQLGETTLAERPELVGDTIVVDKLIRRSVLGDARYPVDIVYEDNVLTAELASRLDRVVVTDVPLYRWYVRADADDRSITNSRREAGNLDDRVEAYRRSARLLTAAGREDLRLALDRKVVDHDLPLALRDLADRDPEARPLVLAQVTALVEELHPSVRRSTELPGALVLAALGSGDPDEVAAAAALAYREHVTRPAHGYPVDVAALLAPLHKQGSLLFHQVQELRVVGDALHLVLTSWWRAGAVPPAPTGIDVLDRRGRHRRVASAPARAVEGSLETGLRWEAEVPLAGALARVGHLGELDVRVVTRQGGSRVRWTTAVPERLVHDVTVSGRRWGRQRTARAYQTAKGNLSLRRLS